ncbi:MAG TPA: TauD/TfdA family dioxygenase, partial [Candidatus Kapabacteria bacterium]|nr:TauD/TfdA family dioxygenase [Candidatus Kapabacteria bacterium]
MYRHLPVEQKNGFTWYGPDWIAREKEWIIVLSQDEIAELETSAERWDAAHKSGNIETIIVRNFDLPKLAPKLLALREELIHGRGFALLRGLQVANYTEREAAIIFCGLGSHLGLARPQNAQGHLLGHVRDMGMISQDPNVRIYQTKERQTFHTDSTDVVGLLCLNTAKTGGLSLLVSSSTIFNEMHKRRPDLLKLLMGPIATDR